MPIFCAEVHHENVLGFAGYGHMGIMEHLLIVSFSFLFLGMLAHGV